MVTVTEFLGEGLGSILSFLVAMVPLIALHEMGHMFAAKAMGVWVREFGIGFPPRIVKLFRWQETDFTLNAIPLGGFARMEGEGFVEEAAAVEIEEGEELTPEELAESEEALEHSLYTQPPHRRLPIFAAGPLTNLVTGWLLAVILFLTGVPVIDKARVHINNVVPDSPAEEVGLQADDVILSLDGEVPDTLEEVTAMVEEKAGESVEIRVQRDEETLTYVVTPRFNPELERATIGVQLLGEPLEYHLESTPFPEALWEGTRTIGALVGGTVMIPVYVLRGAITVQEARPIGIVNVSRIAYQTIEQSVTTGTLLPILNLLIVVNVSLAIFNLLPIPALDGGHILLTLVEMVRGRPVDPEVQVRIQQAAWVLLILMFVVITALDLLYPVNLPTAP
jgi:regulator of sigma E protease